MPGCFRKSQLKYECSRHDNVLLIVMELGVGAWSSSGVWALELGASSPVSLPEFQIPLARIKDQESELSPKLGNASSRMASSERADTPLNPPIPELSWPVAGRRA